jgi:hypothetical protein
MPREKEYEQISARCLRETEKALLVAVGEEDV